MVETDKDNPTKTYETREDTFPGLDFRFRESDNCSSGKVYPFFEEQPFLTNCSSGKLFPIFLKNFNYASNTPKLLYIVRLSAPLTIGIIAHGRLSLGPQGSIPNLTR